MSLSQLAIKFFCFYGWEFDYKRHIITVSNAVRYKRLVKTARPGRPNCGNGWQIRDPWEDRRPSLAGPRRPGTPRRERRLSPCSGGSARLRKRTTRSPTESPPLPFRGRKMTGRCINKQTWCGIDEYSCYIHVQLRLMSLIT
jgi:hypothetical protein